MQNFQDRLLAFSLLAFTIYYTEKKLRWAKALEEALDAENVGKWRLYKPN